jgi:hypothetical protein
MPNPLKVAKVQLVRLVMVGPAVSVTRKFLTREKVKNNNTRAKWVRSFSFW